MEFMPNAAKKIVYRIERTKYKNEILAGIGAEKVGGRWNEKGSRMVYTSDSPALAVLEKLIYIEPLDFEAGSYSLAFIEIPEESIFAPPVEAIPSDWNVIQHTLSTKQFGQQWLQAQQTLALCVPSIVMPYSRNYLLNPRHELIHEVKIIDIQPYVFDVRWLKEPTVGYETQTQKTVVTALINEILGSE